MRITGIVLAAAAVAAATAGVTTVTLSNAGAGDRWMAQVDSLHDCRLNAEDGTVEAELELDVVTEGHVVVRPFLEVVEVATSVPAARETVAVPFDTGGVEETQRVSVAVPFDAKDWRTGNYQCLFGFAD